MRNGILLAEDSPNNILQKFESDSLEDAFLALSQKQGKSEEADQTRNQKDAISNVMTSVDVIENIPSEKPSSIVERAKPILKRNLSSSQSQDEKSTSSLKDKLSFTSHRRMKALMTKNLVQLLRQPS